MSVSRRGFVRAAGLSATGFVSSSFIIGRGREAAAFEPEQQVQYDDGILRISSNENARGPGPRAIEAIREAMSPRMGRGYPPDHTAELVDAIAEVRGVRAENIVVGTGSGTILAGATRAFCSAERPLVTAAPTYGTPESTANRIGAGVRSIPVDASLGLDLDAMAAAARGAGMVFLCNPNNPTGTAHSAAEVEAFLRRIKRESPETAVLVDEAYLDYVHDPAVRTAIPLTVELPGVFVTRSMSKAHGMAGLRVGYAIGQKETLDRITAAWELGSMNTLSAAAAAASLRDRGHIEEERRENARIRDFTLSAFRDMGYEPPDSHGNFVFVDLGRPAAEFRDACLELGVRVGRDFPPLERTHCRVSLGTMEEMQASVAVFRRVLQESTAGA
ncbi:MAG TPA: histidinol-phosphate transaminase [Longimicrobiales bacterium]|nr:histidinol-phosphate transaminase [Longimicrobiales bacterium]